MKCYKFGPVLQLALLSALGAGLTGCLVPIATHTENIEAVERLYSGQRLSIQNIDGDVAISGWDHESVSIEAEKVIDVYYGPLRAPEYYLEALKVNVHGDQYSMFIESDFPDNLPIEGVRPVVNYAIKVPRRLVLSLTNPHGNVIVANTQGNLAIKVDQGDVDITHPELPDETETISVHVTYGNVNILLPEDGSFVVDASTNLGQVYSGDFQLIIDYIIGHPHMHGTIGAGGAIIDIGVYMGYIRFHAI